MPTITKQTYASPLSFVGGTRRLTGWARRHRWWGWTLFVLAVLPFWVFLIAWYVIVFGVFGLVTIPFRFFRRHQRKSLAVQQAQLEELQRISGLNRD